MTFVELGLSRFVVLMLCGPLIRGRVVEREEKIVEEKDDEMRHGGPTYLFGAHSMPI